jgi:hypothetical protein
VLVWLPAILFFTLRVLRRGRWQDVAALGLVLGVQFLGGHPESSLYNALIWLLCAGYWLWRSEIAANLPRAALAMRLAVAGGLGVGLGAVAWLPLADALWQSEVLATRSQNALTWASVFFQWREWLNGVTLLLPDFFGNPRYAASGVGYWNPYSNYVEASLYVGLLPLALALLAMWRGRGRHSGRQIILWTVLGLLAVGLALRLPLFPLLAEIPPLHVTNVGRLRGLFLLTVALLAGYGLDQVRASWMSSNTHGEGGEADLRWLTQLLFSLGAMATVIALAAWIGSALLADSLVEMARSQAVAAQGNPFFFRLPEEYAALAEMRVKGIIGSFAPGNWPMYLPLLLALLVIAASYIARRWVGAAWRPTLFSTLLLLLTLGELWRVGDGFNPTVAPESVLPTPPLVAQLLRAHPPGQPEPYRVAGTALTLLPNVGMAFGLEDVRGYDPVASHRYMAVMNHLPHVARVGHHLLFTEAQVPFFDFLNVRYLFTPHTLAGAWEHIGESDGLYLYENHNALPRAYMVYRSEVARTPADSLAMTVAPDFDFRTTVVLEDVLEGAGAARQHAPPAVAPQVQIAARTPGAMTIEVETASAGWLVISDPYTSGWVATMNGAATEILIANHAFRAVSLPAGEQTVTLRYQPASFVVGAWSSGISLLLLLIVGSFGVSTKYRRGERYAAVTQ